VAQSRRASNARRPHEVPRVSIEFDPDNGRTHQSFKDECDINRIVSTFARTGIVPHVQKGEPQYGDCPDVSFFDAACAQAEIASAFEDGFTLEAPEEPSGDDLSAEGQDAPETAESVSDAQEPAGDQKSATEG
jgi:hypothetical protein